ncbi:hypothetical protein P9112_007049 [Eukaryota sp. TZLM1-RC]
MLTTEELHAVHSNPALIRNICIISHVDHGKSTLADSLLSSNAVISPSTAGLIRYMDNRPDEQERGITMKSSAHALACVHDSKPYSIMLVDTPGHVDFAVEVTAAMSMADGALILVDAVEGLCAQTYAVMRSAFESDIVPILVINKIDRLVTELRESPIDSYKRLRNLIEQVNVAVASMLSESAFSRILSHVEKRKVQSNVDQSNVDDDELDLETSKRLFNPSTETNYSLRQLIDFVFHPSTLLISTTTR